MAEAKQIDFSECTPSLVSDLIALAYPVDSPRVQAMLTLGTLPPGATDSRNYNVEAIAYHLSKYAAELTDGVPGHLLPPSEYPRYHKDCLEEMLTLIPRFYINREGNSEWNRRRPQRANLRDIEVEGEQP